MVYIVVKLAERRFVVAREGLTGMFSTVAECKSEAAAREVSRLLNEHPETEAVAVAARKHRVANRMHMAAE